MYLKTITLTPSAPGIPIPIIVTGIGSDVVLLLAGVPTGFTPILMFKPAAAETPVAVYGTVLESGLWSVTLGGWNFTAAECTHYDIVIQNTTASLTTFAGRGILHILDTYSTGALPVTPPTVPAFAVNTVTGLKYPIYATTNTDGDTTLTVGQVPLNPPTEEEGTPE